METILLEIPEDRSSRSHEIEIEEGLLNEGTEDKGRHFSLNPKPLEWTSSALAQPVSWLTILAWSV